MANSLEKYPFAERILFSADQRVVENHSNYSDRGNALVRSRPRAAEREWIRVSRINSSGERIVRSRHARFIDALAAWNRNCVRLRVMLECDEIKSDISRARMWVIPFRFDNELFWKFFFLPFSFQSFKHLIESFDAIISLETLTNQTLSYGILYSFRIKFILLFIYLPEIRTIRIKKSINVM